LRVPSHIHAIAEIAELSEDEFLRRQYVNKITHKSGISGHTGKQSYGFGNPIGYVRAGEQVRPKKETENRLLTVLPGE
jgi:hypothetical protein